MDLKLFITIFTAIFIAELGDKTQLATMLFATDKEVSKIGVVAGSFLSQHISAKHLHIIAGIGFIGIGIWILIKA
jgi:putative Ca2+/H+ antiporter (TMEM165/GDT1 family)